MGRKAKSQRSAVKKAEKRAIKAQRHAEYQANAVAGKRKKHSNMGKKSSGVSHAVANCGNPGCSRCYPQFRKKNVSIPFSN